MNTYDMLYLPHPVSKKHPRMSIIARSAQFAPFAALVGYEDLVFETGKKVTEEMNKNENEEWFD